MSLAMELGEHIVRSTPDALDRGTLECIKRLVLDQVACIIAGTTRPQARVVAESASILGDSIEASIMPFGPRVSRARAVYFHSYCGNLVDADDTFVNDDWTVVGHVGAVVVPVGLACSEFACKSGLELAVAIALGYDIAIRMGLAARPSVEDAARAKGMGTWQILGAAATASKLLDLTSRECAHALCIAAVSAPVPSLNAFYDKANRVAWIKNNLGWASLGGLISALLAGRGMKGNLDLFDAGEFSRMCASSQWDESCVQVFSPQSFFVRQVSLKPYPACWYTIGALNAAHQLVSKYGVFAEGNIQRVIVEVQSDFLAAKLSRYPSDSMDVPFSIPYLIACSLLGDYKALWSPDSDTIDSHSIKELGAKIDVRLVSTPSYSMSETYAKIIVHSMSGEIFTVETSLPPGSSVRPLGRTALETKFVRLVEPVMGRTRADKLLAMIEHMDEIANMSEVCTEVFLPAE